MDIGEVSRRSGVPVSTLRYYEEKGLIASIALGRSASFSLDEIARMFAPDGQPRIDRKMLTAKADDIDRNIRRLRVMRDGLRHAAACRAPSHMECPTFRRALKVVTARGSSRA
jgi:DNA-binding transcriptional MerR regulator